MIKSEVHEVLVTLYLRLNGYFTTGLIVHSPSWGNVRAEIDCLAIRHPHHEQSDRVIETDAFLDPQEALADLIICEVKSNPQQVRFNESLRTNPEILQRVLGWTGVLEREQWSSVADKLQALLRADVSGKEVRAGIIEGSCRVRPLLCCPPSLEPIDNRWCLTWTEISRFINDCLTPQQRRQSCSTQYPFDLWGYPFAPIIKHFKDKSNKATLENLYEFLGATKS